MSYTVIFVDSTVLNNKNNYLTLKYAINVRTRLFCIRSKNIKTLFIKYTIHYLHYFGYFNGINKHKRQLSFPHLIEFAQI